MQNIYDQIDETENSMCKLLRNECILRIVKLYSLHNFFLGLYSMQIDQIDKIIKYTVFGEYWDMKPNFLQNALNSFRIF